MDIGTAKASSAERERVEYAGVDLVDPTEKFSVGDYLRAVAEPIKKATAENRKIIIAGGTGLYVKCLTQGFDDLPPENLELRERLETLSVSELQDELLRKDSARFEFLKDKQNPRRLIRAIEMAEQGAPLQTAWDSEKTPVVGLRVPREVLLRRIEKRVDQMYAEGLIEEARALIDLNLSSTALAGIGYAEVFALLRGKIKESEELTVIRASAREASNDVAEKSAQCSLG